jgi:hypothetical protein
MLYFVYNYSDGAGRGRLIRVTSEPTRDAISRNDIKSFAGATMIAEDATKLTGILHIATDAGFQFYPQFAVIEAPKVGDLVSKTINGDYYPVGEIISVSKTLKVIRTSTGLRFDRLGHTGSWRCRRTWILVSGHIDQRNPHI